MFPSYSYSPQKLTESFRTLAAKEDQAQKDAVADSFARVVGTATRRGNSASAPFVVAAVQLTAGGLPDHSVEGFWERAQEAVRIAAQEKGAKLILLPELFIGPYFCQSQEACLQNLAMELPTETTSNFLIARMQFLAKTHEVVLPISIFERKHNALYNSVVMIDADGTLLGTYRKSHIPDGTGYQEKFYFTPGDTGFRVWDTKIGKVGVAICWDQWFPEAARAMALQGAEVLLYPTAIGSEPQDPTINSADHWQRVMQGHAGANVSAQRFEGPDAR
jgi:N-carbamoylputrescine amidase